MLIALLWVRGSGRRNSASPKRGRTSLGLEPKQRVDRRRTGDMGKQAEVVRREAVARGVVESESVISLVLWAGFVE